MARFTSIKILIPFILGLTLSYCSVLSIWWIIALLIASLFTVSLLSKGSLHYQRWLLSAPIWVLLLLFGFIRQELEDRERKKIANIEINGEHTFVGLIDEIPKKNKRIAAKMQLLATDQQTYSNIDLLLYLPLDTNDNINPGDTIIATGYFSRLRPNANPYAFDYSKYLAKSNIYYQVYAKLNFSIIPCEKLPWYKIISWGWRIALLQRLKLIVAEDTYEIAAALLLGDRSLMSDDTSEDFKNVGAIHVLAVSGLHVGIVIFLFFWVLQSIPKNWQKVRISMGLICVIVLLIFSDLTGGLAPVRRAAIMFSFLLFNKVFSSRYDSLNILALTALVLLLINPTAIADVGFQLSFAAVASIICFYPLFYKSIYLKKYYLDRVWSLVCLSMAAQVFTFPITMYYFHQFPLLFALSSIIAIIMATIIIYIGLASLALSFLWLSAAKWGGLLLDFSVGFLRNSISYMASWNGTVIHSIWIESYELALLMICLVALTIFIYSKRSSFLITSLICLNFQLLIHNINLYKSLSQQEVIVYDTKLPMIDIIIGRNVYSWSHPELTENEKYYAATYARMAKKIKKIEPLDFENFSLLNSRK